MLALTATRVFARRYRFLRELTPVNVARHVRGKAASHTLLELRRVRCTMLKGMEPIVSPLLGKARHEAGAGPMLKRTRGLTCCGPAQEPREMGRAQAIVRVVEASLPAYPANARSLVTRASRRFDARPTPPRSAFVNDCVAIIAQGKGTLAGVGTHPRVVQSRRLLATRGRRYRRGRRTGAEFLRVHAVGRRALDLLTWGHAHPPAGHWVASWAHAPRLPPHSDRIIHAQVVHAALTGARWPTRPAFRPW
jgi:hypothetical protein